jgi:choloylglycine hydrolase
MTIKRIISVLFSALSLLLACTSFVFDQQHIYLAKNLDWDIDRGYILYNLDGIQKSSILDPELQWISQFKSITNNQFGKGFPLGGMNERGLVIEELSLFGQAYQYDDSKRLLNEFQWIQYQLDVSASVDDVIKSLDSITIGHSLMNIHYLMTDRFGDRAVIECLEDGLVIYRDSNLPYPVLSNNPYKKALRYLGFFEGYGGDMRVQHRSGSQERFVSCVDLLNNDPGLINPVDYAFDLLDRVRQEDTQWQFVYDVQHLAISCHTKSSDRLFEISFKDLNHIKHNKFAVPLFKDRFKRTKLKVIDNSDQLEFVYRNLGHYFPGKHEIFILMMEEGGKSLDQK